MASASDPVDYFALLNLSAAASDEDVSRRIHEEQRLWVKRTEAADMALRQEAERRVKQLKEAKRILLDPNLRKAHEAELRSRPVPTAQDDSPPAAGDDLIAVAQQHLAEGDARSAVYVASRAVERHPGVAEAWAALADGKLSMGRADDAIYEYRKAVELAPEEPLYHLGLEAHEHREEWDEALASYQMASRIDPSNTFSRVGVANVYAQSGRAQKAVPILEQAASELPESDAVRFYLALAYCEAIVESWTPLDNGMWTMTTPQQGAESDQLVQKAQALGVIDPGVVERLSELADKVRFGLTRHWIRPLGHTVKWAALLLALFLIFASFSVPIALLVLAGAGLWIYLGLQPGWKINRKETLGSQAPGPAR